MDKTPLKIFVGWDSREDIAYQVCKKSIEENTDHPVEIVPLKLRELQKKGVYYRNVDELASTEFTFTRFLVPHLCDFEGWALFIDCDFLFLEDVKDLFRHIDNTKAVMCVQHDYNPGKGYKMDGKKQTIYPRKNWSSMVLWNCGHPANKLLTTEYVNDENKTGAHFHRFSWLADKEIGEVPKAWNYLVGWYKESRDGKPSALHYTEGGPWFDGYKDCEYATEWKLCEGRYYQQLSAKLDKQLREHKSKIIGIEETSFTDEKKDILNNFLNSTIDPTEQVYKDVKSKVEKGVEKEMGKKVAALAPDKGDYNYDKKGVEYDPYCRDFILGAGGVISTWDREQETQNTLVIRGLGGTSQKALKYCMEKNRDFYAIDTGYLQPGSKKEYHRITKNALQNLGPLKQRPYDRLRNLNWSYRKNKGGSKILVCPPSAKVMKFYQQDLDTWMQKTIREIKRYTDRPIEVRLKPSREDRVTNNTIWQALEDVHCLITYNSIAATEALLHSVPAIALAPNSARLLCNQNISELETGLFVPSKDELLAFVAHLSYCQFTAQEMRNGYAWRVLNGLED